MNIHLPLQILLVLYIYMEHCYKMSFDEYCFGRLYSIFGLVKCMKQFSAFSVYQENTPPTLLMIVHYIYFYER